MDIEELMMDLEIRMDKAIESFQRDLSSVRTGRANASMFDKVLVDYYGEMTPINQMSTITIPEARQIVIRPYEKEHLRAVEKAISESSLGLTPNNDGTIIRIIIPALTEERRREYTKMASKMAEDAKVAIRNIRRDGNDKVKSNKTVSEDIRKGTEEDIQKLTDKYIAKIDTLYKAKEADLLAI